MPAGHSLRKFLLQEQFLSEREDFCLEGFGRTGTHTEIIKVVPHGEIIENTWHAHMPLSMNENLPFLEYLSFLYFKVHEYLCFIFRSVKKDANFYDFLFALLGSETRSKRVSTVEKTLLFQQLIQYS